jgi:nitrile hydratase
VNGIHDLGGMHGMGELPFEANEPVFHEEWEKKVFGLVILVTTAGLYTSDESRYATEQIPALRYLASPYYLHWLDAMERVLLEKGVASRQELVSGRSETPLSSSLAAKLKPPAVDEIFSICTASISITREAEVAPKYNVGARIRARNVNPKTHTRLPRYVRGHVGTITSVPGCFPYADSRAIGKGDHPQHVYTIRFEGAELWGLEARSKDAVYLDLYETYIEAVE